MVETRTHRERGKIERERHQKQTDQPTTATDTTKFSKPTPTEEREVGRCNKAFIFMTLSWGNIFFRSFLFLFFFFGLLFGLCVCVLVGFEASCILLGRLFFLSLVVVLLCIHFSVDVMRERERFLVARKFRNKEGKRERENRSAMTTCEHRITLHSSARRVERKTKTFTHGPPLFHCVDTH